MSFGQGPICNTCKRVVMKLVKLNDNGTGKELCRDCKRCIRNNKPIEHKFKGRR